MGVRLFRAMCEVGMGQGNPIFALVYCLVNELRVQLVSQSAPLRNLGWIDDSSWISTSRQDIQQVAFRLPVAGNLTNLFSDTTKKPLVLAPTYEANKSFSTGNTFISRACPYVCRQMATISVSWAGMHCHMSSPNRTFANSWPRVAGLHSLFVIGCHRLSIKGHIPRHDLHLPFVNCPLYLATPGGKWKMPTYGWLDGYPLSLPGPIYPCPPHGFSHTLIGRHTCSFSTTPFSGLFYGPFGCRVHGGRLLVPDGMSIWRGCGCP